MTASPFLYAHSAVGWGREGRLSLGTGVGEPRRSGEKRMFRGLLWDGVFLLTASVFVIGGALRGDISIGMTVFVLLAFTVIRAAARIAGSRIGRSARLTFGIGLPVASLLVLAITYGNGSIRESAGILGSILLVWAMIFGVLVMIRGPFLRRR